MMPRELTDIQRANIGDLIKLHGVKVAYVGFDARGWPVLEVADTNGVQFIAWAPGGLGRQPMPPIRELTDDEYAALNVKDADLLYSIPQHKESSHE